MKVLVFGGHGFIGKNIVKELAANNQEVFASSRQDGVDLTKIDDAIKSIRQVQPDIIVNCASQGGSLHYVTKYAADVIDVNMRIVLNLYLAVKEINPEIKIINLISNCSYPGNSSVQIESKYWDGPIHNSVWSFGNSRRMWVALAQCYKMQYGISTVNFLVPNAYGPEDSTDPNKTHALDGMIIRMLQAHHKGDSSFEIWGTGKPVREWIYVEDIAKIVVNSLALTREKPFALNLAQNKSHSIEETANMIKDVIGYQGSLTFNPSYQDGDPLKQMDDTLFRQVFPQFTFTDIKKGIEDTVNYYKNTITL